MIGYPARGVHGQIVHLLGRKILSGSLEPGHTIDLDDLELELGVSRTAMREALRVLAAKGLVGSRQNRGTFVRPRDEWSLLDADVISWRLERQGRRVLLEQLAEVRMILEPAAARLAAQRRTNHDLQALREALAAMVTASAERVGIVEADLGFHRALLAASHNEMLARMGRVMEASLGERDRLVHDDEEVEAELEDQIPLHDAVLDAVQAADPDQAEKAMVALLARAERDVETSSRKRRERRSGVDLR